MVTPGIEILLARRWSSIQDGAKNFRRLVEQSSSASGRITEAGFTCGHETEKAVPVLQLENGGRSVTVLSVEGVAQALWHTVLQTIIF